MATPPRYSHLSSHAKSYGHPFLACLQFSGSGRDHGNLCESELQRLASRAVCQLADARAERVTLRPRSGDEDSQREEKDGGKFLHPPSSSVRCCCVARARRDAKGVGLINDVINIGWPAREIPIYMYTAGGAFLPQPSLTYLP